MEVAPGVGAVAAVGGAGVVHGGEGAALRLGVEALLAAEVEGREVPDRTAGRIPALQAIRRAWAALISSPVSRLAPRRSVSSWSWSRRITTVAAVLWWSRSVGRCSRSSVKAWP
ncbi:MAG: hypothetical protein R2734_13860 [Nocardioides sp.]